MNTFTESDMTVLEFLYNLAIDKSCTDKQWVTQSSLLVQIKEWARRRGISTDCVSSKKIRFALEKVLGRKFMVNVSTTTPTRKDYKIAHMFDKERVMVCHAAHKKQKHKRLKLSVGPEQAVIPTINCVI